MTLSSYVKKALNEGSTVYHFEPNSPGLQFTKVGDIIFSTELTDTENHRYGNEHNHQPRRLAEDQG